MTKKMIGLILGLFIFSTAVFGQDWEKYSTLVREAIQLYQKEEYRQSAETFSKAFDAAGGIGKISDRYNAACIWSLANEPDSAFVQLFKIANSGHYTDADNLTNDPDFENLYTDARWNEVVEIVKANKDQAEAKLDKPLVELLDSIYDEDQQYRAQIEEIIKNYGMQSPEMKNQWKLINEKDSLNQIEITKILDERGWLGADVVGRKGNMTLFLVIQHAGLPIQEKYLPMMRDALSKGNANPEDLALLEDRVAIRQGKRQIYGSQIGHNAETGEYYVMPLDDPDNVDKRRASVGLGLYQEYLSLYGMIWDPEEYKKQLPEIEAKSYRF